MSRAYELGGGNRWFMAGLKLYLYQLAIGLSIRWWPCLRIRGYAGPIEFWFYTYERKAD